MKHYWIFAILLFSCCLLSAQGEPLAGISLFPANGSTQINPDTHLVLTFPSTPTIGNSGKIRVYDASDDRLVDVLDMSIPPGPTQPHHARIPYTEVPYVYIPGHWTNANTQPGTHSGTAQPTPDSYQLTIIGGFTDGFHFYPIIVHDNVATITLHHNLLEYNKTYYVQIDPGVLTLEDNSFAGIPDKTWTFSTKTSPPPADSKWLVVNADGSDDFNTLQGALDFLPDYNRERVTIFIKNGIYEEIIYFRHKANITILGEDRDKVKVCYFNNEVFNPHPVNITTNEIPGTFPSRRAAFMGDVSSGIHLINFTIESLNPKPAQAEGLLLVGERHIVSNMTIIGQGDALQLNGSVYLENIQMTGYGDNVLSRGPCFFKDCELISTRGPHIWIRNPFTNHGCVLVDCTLRGSSDKVHATIARRNKAYTFCEAVLLNCKLANIRPEGWFSEGGDESNVHYWEYNSTNLSDGQPIDASQRHPISRQLTQENDAELIAEYSDPANILGGWTPTMAPAILAQPTSVKSTKGKTAFFNVRTAALPEATYQWFKNNTAINGATAATLTLDKVGVNDAATYTVVATNDSGSVTSKAVTLTVNQ